jgi:hypothetical protein
VEDVANTIFKDDTSQDSVQGALERLRQHRLTGDPLWISFTEEALKNDNKLLEHRTNLLTMAMKPVNDRLQYDFCGEIPSAEWIGRMRSQLAAETYTADTNLLVFDLACNIVASSCRKEYNEICLGSYLNPANYEAIMKAFLGSIDSKNHHSLPVAVGFQEFPAEASLKAQVFERLLKSQGYSLIRGQGSLAFVHRGFSRKSESPRVLTPEAFQPQDVMNQCIEEYLEGGSSSSHQFQPLNEKIRGSLKTTARKTFAVELSRLIFIVVHCKEPKTAVESTLLARYMKALGKISQSACQRDTEQQKAWVLCSDTNLGFSDAVNSSFYETLADEAEGRPARWVPSPSRMTTSKHRSVLHGQCYDAKKVGRTVTAAKDYLVTSAPDYLHQCQVTPDLDLELSPDGKAARTLPTSDWGSDHCLVTAVYSPFSAEQLNAIYGQGFSTVLQAFKSMDRNGSGSIQPQSLMWLFSKLSSHPEEANMKSVREDIDLLAKKSGAMKFGEVHYEDFLRYLFFLDESTAQSA